MEEKILAKLVIAKGNRKGKEYLIESEIINVGRWDPDSGSFPDIDLTEDDDESKISRKHARIVCRGGQFFLEDLGSLNGSYINRGQRLSPSEPNSLKDGDEIIMGKTFFNFHILKDED